MCLTSLPNHNADFIFNQKVLTIKYQNFRLHRGILVPVLHLDRFPFSITFSAKFIIPIVIIQSRNSRLYRFIKKNTFNKNLFWNCKIYWRYSEEERAKKSYIRLKLKEKSARIYLKCSETLQGKFLLYQYMHTIISVEK